MSKHTGAEVLRAALVAVGACTLPSAVPGGAWPGFVGNMASTPDNVVCVYDTAGIREGRIQATGETLAKAGWQVGVRATDYRTGAAYMAAIQEALDGLLRKAVAIDGSAYTVQAVKQTGTVIPLGREFDGTRILFTLNGTITFSANT